MPDAPLANSPRSALEHRTNFLLSLLVVAGIVAVAYTDLVVQSHVSLGYLFLSSLGLQRPGAPAALHAGSCGAVHYAAGPAGAVPARRLGFPGAESGDVRRLPYTNAGHEPPFLFRPRTGEVIWLDKGGLVLGLLPEAQYESATLAVEPGDLLVLYTDGVSDTENEGGEAFTRRRLPGLVASLGPRSAAEVVEAIHRAVAEFRRSCPQGDDTTVIVLRLL